MNVSLIAIDLAKNTFQVCGVNRQGKEVFNRSTSRKKLTALIAQYPGIPVAMEACSGSNYWGRTFQQSGHEVLLIPSPHVKPFVNGNKNDRNDAFAISEAARRPKMRVVAPRSLEQTDMVLLHRIRERRVRARTALMNQMRGFLSEYGIALPAGVPCGLPPYGYPRRGKYDRHRRSGQVGSGRPVHEWPTVQCLPGTGSQRALQRGRGSHWGQRSLHLKNRPDIRQQFDQPTQSLRVEQKRY